LQRFKHEVERSQAATHSCSSVFDGALWKVP